MIFFLSVPTWLPTVSSVNSWAELLRQQQWWATQWHTIANFIIIRCVLNHQSNLLFSTIWHAITPKKGMWLNEAGKDKHERVILYFILFYFFYSLVYFSEKKKIWVEFKKKNVLAGCSMVIVVTMLQPAEQNIAEDKLIQNIQRRFCN